MTAAALALPGTAAGEGSAYSTFHPVASIRDSGPPANRYDFVFAGDGYTGDTDSRAQALATEIAEYLVTPATEKAQSERCREYAAGCRIDTEPYVRYRNFLNFHRIKAYSKAYFGGDDIDSQGRSTSRDGREMFRDSIFGLSHNQPHAVEATAQDSSDGAGIDVDGRGWLADAGIRWAIPPWPQASATHHLPGELFAHEGGHANHDLVDEYFHGDRGYPTGVELTAWNVSADSGCEKWKEWLGYRDRRISPSTGHELGVIGCHEGAMNAATGLFRPIEATRSSRMWTDNPFHRVSMEKVIYDIYGSVRPLDGHRGNGRTLVDPAVLWVDEVDPAVIKVDWTVVDAHGYGRRFIEDGGGVLDVAALGLAAGEYRVTAHAYDEAIKYAYTESSPEGRDIGDLDSLDIVRKPRVIERMQQRVTWRVRLTGRAFADADAGVGVPDGQRFSVDRRHPRDAIVGWVRANAPHGHRLELLDGPAWLSLHAATGRLQVADPAALASHPTGTVPVQVRVTATAVGLPVYSEGTVAIDVNDGARPMEDRFEDGEPGGNAGANGRGFAVPVADMGTVTERNGALVMGIDASAYGSVIVLSKDSFDLSTVKEVAITWRVTPPQAPWLDCHLLLAPVRAPLDYARARGNLEHFKVAVHQPGFGLHVRACGEGAGGVLVSSPRWAREPYVTVHDASLDLDAGAGADFTLFANRDGFRLEVDGEEVYEGEWPPELGMDTPASPAEPWQHRTVRVGALLRGPGEATLGIESVRVSTGPDHIIEPHEPPPANRPPSLRPAGLPALSAVVGEPVSLDLNGYFTDPDLDALRFVYTGLPAGLEAGADGVLRGMPERAGEHVIGITASDGEIAIHRSLTITVHSPPGSPPRMWPIDSLTYVEGQPVRLRPEWFFTDDDGDELAAGVLSLPEGFVLEPDGSISGTAAVVGDAQVLRVWASDGRHRVEGTVLVDVRAPYRRPGPPSEDAGDDDGDARSDEGTDEPAAQGNRAPELAKPLPGVSAKRHRRVVIDLDAYFADPDGDRLRYSVGDSAPPSFRVRRAGRLSGFMPRESVTFTVTARDPAGATAAGTLRLVPDESQPGSKAERGKHRPRPRRFHAGR